MVKKSETVKLYIMIILGAVLAVSAYGRFIHRSKKETAKPASFQLPIAKATKQKPMEEDNSLLDLIKPKQPYVKLLTSEIRDIFSEPSDSRPKNVDKHDEEAKKKRTSESSSMKLKGTILGGEGPIALINDQFLRQGDQIGDYRVTQINRDKVLLSSENHELVLEVLTYARK